MTADHKSLSRIVYLAAGLFIAIWFAYEIIQVILLFFFAIVITIVLNAPTAWLERRKVRRTIAALIVFFLFLIFLIALGWLIIPKIVYQLQLLIADLPQLLRNLNSRIISWLGDDAALASQATAGQWWRACRSITFCTGNHYRNFAVFSFISWISIVVYFFSLPDCIYAHQSPAATGTLSILFFRRKKRKSGFGFCQCFGNDDRLDVVECACRSNTDGYRILFSFVHEYPGRLDLGWCNFFCRTDTPHRFLYNGYSAHSDCLIY